jgi:EpsD family peptidyl-prolyl cis-trans isomerase
MRYGSVLRALSIGAIPVLLAACPSRPQGERTAGSAVPSASASAAPEADVLATVNGVPIRISDVHFVLSQQKRGRGADAKTVKATLEQIIDQELARQQAERAKLDRDPEYLRKLRFMEAPVNDFKRTELAKALAKQEVDGRLEVSEADARRFFDQDPARFQTKVHVCQILVRNKPERIRAMKQDIDAGTPFEEVAARPFPATMAKKHPPPWDLGVLRLDQVPESWVEPLEKMKPGEVSDILSGPRGRQWIIKLVARERDASITFEQVKPGLLEILRGEQRRKLRTEVEKQRRDQAKIVYVREPGAMRRAPGLDQ